MTRPQHVCDEAGCRKRFESLQQLRSHETSHLKGVCPTCGDSFKLTGLGPHKTNCAKRAAKAEAASLAEKRVDRAIDRLAVMLTAGLGPDAVARVDEFLRRIVEPAPDARMVVVGPTFGPHLSNRANVGGLVLAAKEPCLIVDLALVVDPPADRAGTRGGGPRW